MKRRSSFYFSKAILTISALLLSGCAALCPSGLSTSSGMHAGICTSAAVVGEVAIEKEPHCDAKCQEETEAVTQSIQNAIEQNNGGFPSPE